MKTKKLTICAMLLCVAMIFSYIENLFPPPIPVPGIKLGLANIAVLTALFCFDFKTAGLIMILKVTVSTILFSTFFAFIYSLSGGIFSLVIMVIFKKFKFNIISVSIAGGIFHNLAQLFAAAILLSNINILYYMSVLIISGTICAFATGIVSSIVIKRLKHVLHE